MFYNIFLFKIIVIHIEKLQSKNTVIQKIRNTKQNIQ
jgi:hypothetical protein